ncbi:MAG: DNA polymerase III subunit beta [Chloroflexi bacterium]|nr:DNA polymerase III subunit beta [Chloroflexota bacterium]
MQAKGLRQLLDRVAFAAATEDSRPILTGVLARFENQRVTFAAGDGFRLSVQHAVLGETFTSANGNEPVKVVIPVRALQEVMRLMGDQAEPVEIAINANRTQVRIKLTSAEVGAQLIEGAFPDFTRIIPQTHTSRAVVTSAELFTAAKMVSAIVEKHGKHNGVRLEADPRQARLIVIGVHPEQGDGVGEVDAAIEGDAFRVSLQAPYFLNILERLTASPQVAIEFLQKEGQPAPVVIRAVGDDDFLHLMMPLDDTPRATAKAASPSQKATVAIAA